MPENEPIPDEESFSLLLIAQTTVGTPEEARRLADLAIQTALAACVQIEQAIESVYHWKGKTRTDQEVRLTFKAPLENSASLKSLILANHPYNLPEWIHWHAETTETYRQWAEGSGCII